MKLIAAVAVAVAVAAVLAGCDSGLKADGVAPQLVERVTLACQDRSMLDEITSRKAAGDALASTQLAERALLNGNCTVLQAGARVVAEAGQHLAGRVKVRVPGNQAVYWTSGESLRLI